MKIITGIQVAYWFVCHRKLWLTLRGISIEKQSDLVQDGKRVAQNAYKQRKQTGREVELPGIKIDFFDPDTRTVYETKRSPSLVEAHRWQVRYYLYVLKQHGMGLCTGILEYPKHKRRETVELLPEHEALLAELPTRFQELAAGTCPPPIEKRICKSCAFAEYCYAELEE